MHEHSEKLTLYRREQHRNPASWDGLAVRNVCGYPDVLGYVDVFDYLHPQQMWWFHFVSYFSHLPVFWHLPYQHRYNFIVLETCTISTVHSHSICLTTLLTMAITLSPGFLKQSGWDPRMRQMMLLPMSGSISIGSVTIMWNYWVKEYVHFNLWGIFPTIQLQSQNYSWEGL